MATVSEIFITLSMTSKTYWEDNRREMKGISTSISCSVAKISYSAKSSDLVKSLFS